MAILRSRKGENGGGGRENAGEKSKGPRPNAPPTMAQWPPYHGPMAPLPRPNGKPYHGPMAPLPRPNGPPYHGPMAPLPRPNVASCSLYREFAVVDTFDTTLFQRLQPSRDHRKRRVCLTRRLFYLGHKTDHQMVRPPTYIHQSPRIIG